MINSERLSCALHYLAETDESAAELKADVERKEYILKRTKALTFSHLEGTVADRQAKAEYAEKVIAAAEDYFSSIRASESMRNKRCTEALIVEVWRSQNASRRAGNL